MGAVCGGIQASEWGLREVIWRLWEVGAVPTGWHEWRKMMSEQQGGSEALVFRVGLYPLLRPPGRPYKLEQRPALCRGSARAFLFAFV